MSSEDEAVEAVAEVADMIACTLPDWVTDMWEWQHWDGREAALTGMASEIIRTIRRLDAKHYLATRSSDAVVQAVERYGEASREMGRHGFRGSYADFVKRDRKEYKQKGKHDPDFRGPYREHPHYAEIFSEYEAAERELEAADAARVAIDRDAYEMAVNDLIHDTVQYSRRPTDKKWLDHQRLARRRLDALVEPFLALAPSTSEEETTDDH